MQDHDVIIAVKATVKLYSKRFLIFYRSTQPSREWTLWTGLFGSNLLNALWSERVEACDLQSERWLTERVDICNG